MTYDVDQDEDNTALLEVADSNDPAVRRARGLLMVRRLREAHIALVPHTPSQYMCAMGAQAAGVDLFTARRIYRAMLAAAEETPPTVN